MSFRTFADIQGHGAQLDVLRRICASEQPAHAYLFEGPEGVGKRTVAWALACRLACERPDPVAGACGACRSCHAAQRGEHPDLTLLERDGASIRIGQVREALKRLRYEPVVGQVKALIVDDADLMREEAANALLKTLEEPPSRTHFVLVTSRPALLLGTIHSRSQSLRFAELATEDVAAVLRAEGVDAGLVAMAAPLSEGSVSRARTLCDPEWLRAVDDLVRFLLGLGQGSPLRVAGAVETLGGALEGLAMGAAPEEVASEAAPTASVTEARALAKAERSGAPAKRKSKKALAAEKEAAAGPRLKGLDRVGLAWALDVTRAVLRDAMLVAAGQPAAALPLARHADALEAFAGRTHAGHLAAALDVCLATEAGLVLNPNVRLALESTWLEVDRLVRRA